MDKKSIGDIFDKYKTDKGPRRHGYNQCYADVFKDFTPSSILEIGIYEGRSLAAWRELFPLAKIDGIDTFARKQELVFTPENVGIIKGNSFSEEFAKTITDTYDIIIDDGDHRPNGQWNTFLNFKDKWSKVYVVEDVITEDNELLMRKRFHSLGYKNITTYRSAFRGNVRTNNVMVDSAFFTMVIRK